MTGKRIKGGYGQAGWVLPGNTRPSKFTRPAVATYARTLAMEGVTLTGGCTIQQARDSINDKLFNTIWQNDKDVELVEVLDYFISKGFGDTLLREILPRYL